MDRSISENGFVIAQQVAAVSSCESLLSALGPITTAGKRGLLAVPVVAEFARSENLLALIRPHLLAEPVPVRAIYFDKSPDANWFVGWHQDLTIALSARAEVPGFNLWTVKDGIPHAQPPVEFLEHMLTVRLHLDDADASNGALRVLPGSHCSGFIPEETVNDWVQRHDPTTCIVPRGGAVVIRPLLLHASSKATRLAHRRVLHIEFASQPLPNGLEWAIRV